MDFTFSDKQKELRERSREFATKELVPKAREIDETAKFPRDNFTEMATHGFLGITFPIDYGGSGLDVQSYCIVLEEIAKACGSTAIINLSHVLTATSIQLFGNRNQKNFYLASMAKGESLGAFAMTESSGGSDVGAIKTEALLEGDHYTINGEKSYITNAGQADYYILTASIDKTKGIKGLSSFIIEKDREGLSLGKVEDLSGMRGISLGQIILHNCRIPRENIIGNEGDGIKVALSCIDRGRIALSSIGVGIAQASLDASLAYSKKRSQFGKSISEFQAIQFMIADMTTETEAARLLTYYAASLVDKESRFTKEASMAKLYSSEVAMRAALKAVQIHGGYGLVKSCPVERYMRDAKVLAIGEGTSEIQRMIIARSMFK